MHKASFILWFGLMAIHVLAYSLKAARRVFADFGRRRLHGVALRYGLLAAALLGGAIVAILTLPLADQWHHWRH